MSTAEIEERLRQEDYERDALEDSLKLAKAYPSGRYLYLGKSSTAQFVQTARDFKQGHSGGIPDRGSFRRPEFWDPPPWHSNTWFQVHYPDFAFPDDDLLSSLVHLYFTEVNPLVPLLHRPSFDKSVKDKLYLADKEFACVLLLVCAFASRYTDDPRVLSEGESCERSSGWKWVNQVTCVRKSLLTGPTVYHLQVLCLLAQFMLGSTVPHMCWTIASIGLRLSEEAGIHRRKAKHAKPSVEDELWKRAFWTLVYLDRQISAFLGRSCCLYNEEIDLDFPIECDDEYWEPSMSGSVFQQPEGKPAVMSYFNCYLKLTSLIALCLRTVYAMKKSQIRLQFLDTNWEKRIIELLNVRLKHWMTAIPDHLRWDPERKDPIHFAQSASLHLQYHHLQMLIHRPFISMPYDSEKFPFYSITVCVSAARVCADIIATQRHRKGHLVPLSGLAAFQAAAVLLFEYWRTKRAGCPVNPADMKLVDACMESLQILETRWQFAGRLWDVLHAIGDLHTNLPSLGPEGSLDEGAIFPQNGVFSDSLSSEILLSDKNLCEVPFVDESSWFSGIELPSMSVDEASAWSQIYAASLESSRLEPPHSPLRSQADINSTETLRKFGFMSDNEDSFLEPSNFCTKSAGTSKPDTLQTTNESHNPQCNEMSLDDWGSFFNDVDQLTHGIWQFEESSNDSATTSGLW